MEHIFKEINNGSIKYDLSVECDENELKIYILQDACALSATISGAKLESQAKQVNKDIESYYEMLRKFFLSTPDNVQLVLNGKDFIVYLDFKIKYFSCKLKKDNFSECSLRLVRKFYTERCLFSEDLKMMSDQKNRLFEEKLSLENQLRDLVQKKRSIESDMYSSFVMVLNEKKMRIQHLNELIETFRQGRPAVNRSVLTKNNGKSKKGKQQVLVKDELSSSDSEKSYNTDDEKPVDLPLSPECSPPSKQNLELLSDESTEEYTLPKRKKITASSTNMSMPSTSKMYVKEEPMETETKEIEENSPVVELSTQDLLNDI